MTLALSLRAPEQVRAAVSSQLNCPAAEDSLRSTLAAEHIRTTVYAASTGTDDQAYQPVHTTRLLANVRTALAGLSKRSDHSSLDKPDDWARQVLDDLAEIGDVFTIGNGYWMATPLRLIEIPNSDVLLVLGSTPTDAVGVHLGARPVYSGVARLISAATLGIASRHLSMVQPIDCWLGPIDDLSTWTRKIIAAYAGRFSSPDEIAVDQLEVYAPDIMRRQRRPSPWVPASQIMMALREPRICRPLPSLAREWRRPYYLGGFGFKGGALTLRQTALLDYDVSFRLRFGFDHRPLATIFPTAHSHHRITRNQGGR